MLFVIAILLFAFWIITAVVAKVTVWAIHLALVAAIALFIAAIVRRVGGPGPA